MRELLDALAPTPTLVTDALRNATPQLVDAYYRALDEVLKHHKDQLASKAFDAIRNPLTAQGKAAPALREQLLQQAIQITSVDRNKAYGNPEDNFANIAEYWNAYLTQAGKRDNLLTPQDVAHLMILMKMARLATNPQHYDSLLDIAGYAACGADCQAK